jgi:hypothetical protein
VVALLERVASRCILSVSVFVKYPFFNPAPALLCVSVNEPRAILRKLANSVGQNRPNPSAMFRVAEADESRI